MESKSGCVLVVEDDPIIQALVQQGLGAVGYETIMAGSGKALFDTLDKEKERIVLILLDPGLPYIVEIRKVTSVPIAVLTGRSASTIN